MILPDKDITAAKNSGDIVIRPYIPANLGTNSYDVTLAPVLFEILPKNRFWRVVHRFAPVLTHVFRQFAYGEHDCAAKEPYQTKEIVIPAEGYVLKPFVGYLGKTAEYTETHKHLPIIYGKSSVGRLFTLIHFTAGLGDVGFCGHWTLEIMTIYRTRVYAGQKIGQLIYLSTSGVPNVLYSDKKDAKYNNKEGSEAMPAKGELK